MGHSIEGVWMLDSDLLDKQHWTIIFRIWITLQGVLYCIFWMQQRLEYILVERFSCFANQKHQTWTSQKEFIERHHQSWPHITFYILGNKTWDSLVLGQKNFWTEHKVKAFCFNFSTVITTNQVLCLPAVFKLLF